MLENMLPLSGVSSAKRKQSHGHQYQKHHHQHVHLPIAKVGMSNSDKPTSSHLRTPGPSRVMGSTTITRKAATPKAMKFTFTDMLRPGNKIPKVAGLSSRTIPVPLHTDPAIPSRATMDYEQARAALISKRHDEPKLNKEPTVQDLDDIEKNESVRSDIADALLGIRSRIVTLAGAPVPMDNSVTRRVLYFGQVTKNRLNRKLVRSIPEKPFHCLDAPNYNNEFYLSLMHWSKADFLAVALGDEVWTWNPSTHEVSLNIHQPKEGEPHPISALHFLNGTHNTTLAVGLVDGDIRIFDTAAGRQRRHFDAHVGRVSSFTWIDSLQLLASGGRSGMLEFHDLRQKFPLVSKLPLHTQELCGLAVSPKGYMLASGGNDNTVNIIDLRKLPTRQPNMNFSNVDAVRVCDFTEHRAAVKALSWCPWDANQIASGGGISDRRIIFWDVNNGNKLKEIETGSQVSGIIWNENYREIISSHGFSTNSLYIWNYATLQKLANLQHHTGRILCIADSPTGEFVASVGADEAICVWNCFERDRRSVSYDYHSIYSAGAATGGIPMTK